MVHIIGTKVTDVNLYLNQFFGLIILVALTFIFCLLAYLNAYKICVNKYLKLCGNYVIYLFNEQ